MKQLFLVITITTLLTASSLHACLPRPLTAHEKLCAMADQTNASMYGCNLVNACYARAVLNDTPIITATHTQRRGQFFATDVFTQFFSSPRHGINHLVTRHAEQMAPCGDIYQCPVCLHSCLTQELTHQHRQETGHGAPTINAKFYDQAKAMITRYK